MFGRKSTPTEPTDAQVRAAAEKMQNGNSRAAERLQRTSPDPANTAGRIISAAAEFEPKN